jgi:alkylated DNA nucleotide flippase Atl1
LRLLALGSGKELVVALGEQIPPGQWESYGGLGAAMKVPSGTGNGRGAASAEDAARLDGLWGETYPWWRVRNADGRLVHGGRERGTKHVITDPFQQGNRRFVGCDPRSGGLRGDPRCQSPVLSSATG